MTNIYPIIFGVIGFAAVFGVVALVIWQRMKKRDPKQLVYTFTDAIIDESYMERDQITVCDPYRQESYFTDSDAFRRRASGKHEIAQFNIRGYATPLYPGAGEVVRNGKLKHFDSILPQVADASGYRALQKARTLAAREKQMLLYKYAIMGTVVVVLIISTVAIAVNKFG